MNRKFVGVGLAIVLAAVGTIALVGYVRGAESRALSGEELVDVLVVSEPIAAGTSAEEIGGEVTTESVPAKVRADGSVGSLEELEGLVAVVDLVPGEQLLVDRFVDQDAFSAVRAQPVAVPPDLLQVSLSLEPQRVVGGQLAPGDRVSVIASFDAFAFSGIDPSVVPTNSAANSSQLVLRDVLVTNVQVEEVLEADGDEDGPTLAPTGNLLVTLAVDQTAAETIVFSAEHGRVWLTVEPRGGESNGDTDG